MLYLDENLSAEILYGGHGYTDNGFDSNAVRIYGEGYRPPQFEALVHAGSLNGFKLVKAGEGNYTGSVQGVIREPDYFSESVGTDPEALKLITNDEVRRNVLGTENEISSITVGIAGRGWKEPPTVYLDWNNSVLDISPTDLEFNATLSLSLIHI